MPVSDTAGREITAFNWVPDSAKGLVKDLRVRWALEELGLPYKVRYLTAFAAKPEGYVKEQPFEQVPTYRDDQVHLFESGAILFYLGEKDERLLPRDPQGKARAMVWVCAAINSVEPMVQTFGLIESFYKDEEWAKLRREGAKEFAFLRLQRVADWLGDKEWLEDRFTIGDLMMVTVLRIADSTGLIEDLPNLKTYKERAQARPAFRAALDAQMAGFTEQAPQAVHA
jgi:glutathione S-transferase